MRPPVLVECWQMGVPLPKAAKLIQAIEANPDISGDHWWVVLEAMAEARFYTLH